jgi:hypothetical protein
MEKKTDYQYSASEIEKAIRATYAEPRQSGPDIKYFVHEVKLRLALKREPKEDGNVE